MPEQQTISKNAVCTTCTLQLVQLCYARAWWFRLFREPLLAGMRLLARWHRINPRDYTVRKPACYGCIRFMKVALKDKSSVFRWLNARVDPIFNRLRNSLLTDEEIARARAFAREAFSPEE
ncbi:MAG: nitroreductase [Armatimonadota bacterium]